MTKTHTANPMTKEQIFTQLDAMPNDTIRAEFIDHLHKMGRLTERQAIDLTTEYIKHATKKPNKNPPNFYRTQRAKGAFF